MITKKFCPRCGSEDVEMVAGGTMGTFICKNCLFSGSVFPEKSIVGSGGIVRGKVDEGKKIVKKKGGRK